MAVQDPNVTLPYTERDPFGVRHQLANLVMVVNAGEREPETVPPFVLAHQAIRVVALGLIFVGDAVGSLTAEVRMTRELLAKRGETAEPDETAEKTSRRK